MDFNKIKEKYNQKIKFFESKEVLNENHIKIFLKGICGMKAFLACNNEIFQPVAIEWLTTFRECRLKFEGEVFITSMFHTAPFVIKILLMPNTTTSFVRDFSNEFLNLVSFVPDHILTRIFINHLSVFEMLAAKITGCDVYSQQIALFDVLFRFFSEYRNYQSNDELLNLEELVANKLFPDIKNKSDLIALFMNMDKLSYDKDRRNFLNKLNRCVEPCKIFSIEAESIKINGNKLTASTLLLNQPHPFWVDFNIDIIDIAYTCAGPESLVLIAKEDLKQLLVARNATHMNLSITVKNALNLESKIDFKFKFNFDATYLIKNVLPYYKSYLSSSNSNNELTPTRDNKIKAKCGKKIITPETIARVNRYDTIIEEQESDEKQERAQLTARTNHTLNSFTFEQTFAKSNASVSKDFNIFQDSAPKVVPKKRPTQDVSNKSGRKRLVLSDATNKIVTSTKLGQSRYNRDKNVKELEFDQTKLDDHNGETISQLEINNQQKSIENITLRKRSKLRNTKKVVNRVVPVQTDPEQINGESVACESIHSMEYNSPSLYDVRNMRQVDTRDNEFVSNIISQVQCKQVPCQNSQYQQNESTKKGLVPSHTSTPLAKINETIDNKKVSHSYRRYAKSKASTTKLGYNTNIDRIEPCNLTESPKRPIRVQAYRQSKAKITNIYGINRSSDENEETVQKEHVVMAEVHSEQCGHKSLENNVSELLTVDYNTMPMPAPIKLEDISYHIISVDDDSDYENINNEQTLKLKSLKLNPKWPEKRTIFDSEYSQHMPMNATTNFDGYRRLSNCNEVVRHSNGTELSTSRQKRRKYLRHTINIDTNIGHKHQLHNLIDVFNQTLKNQLHMTGIQKELQNVKKVRFAKEKSLAQLIETKRQKLSNKQTKILHLLATIKDREKILKESYASIFKKIERQSQRIDVSRSEVRQAENTISQIKQTESDLRKRIIKSITDNGENIRNEIWQQYIVSLGHNMQQQIFNRYL